MNILMVAAENDAIANAKVGGIADVVRDIPQALADTGQQVNVVIPGYQAFSRLPGSTYIRNLEVRFAGHYESVELYQVAAKSHHHNVQQWVIEHPLFGAGGPGKIYCDDPQGRPFATDASKFALFSAAVGQAILHHAFGDVDVIHLHDWHAATLAVLRAFDPEYQPLQAIHTVYTIHNLALQGIRPIADDPSALLTWFPDLMFNHEPLSDPRFNNCYNPMRAGINLADKVHAVSPAYAKEILHASYPAQGYFGGEGLQLDLQKAEQQGRLQGILNGCEYPQRASHKSELGDLFRICENELLKWIGRNPTVDSAHLIACRRLSQLMERYHTASFLEHRQVEHNAGKQPIVITSVGRITDQKVRLLQPKMADNRSALDHLLDQLGDQGIFILLGSGDSQLEQFFTETAAEHANFVFLKGYSEALSETLYQTGDLFLMPSSFEPCGISQMLAMRAGQPCLVHSVGGLKDTVSHLHNGFSFSGDTPAHQAQQLLLCFAAAINMKTQDPQHWQNIVQNATASRFLWRDVANDYLRLLYNH